MFNERNPDLLSARIAEISTEIHAAADSGGQTGTKMATFHVVSLHLPQVFRHVLRPEYEVTVPNVNSFQFSDK